MKSYRKNWKIYAGVLMISSPILIVTGCEATAQYSQLYRNPQTGQVERPLTSDEIKAQQWDGAVTQMQAFKPAADAAGPVTMGIAPLAASLAINIAQAVALFYRRKAQNPVNKLPA